MPNIIVENEGWGSSRVQDVHAVVQSVCSVFRNDASIDVPDPIILRFSELAGPRALLERGPNNEHILLVRAKDRLWAQLAFQFAHEYCHIFSDHYRVPLANRFRWLEESICELASLYALLRMGDVWRESPPYPTWSSYADALTTYANDRINVVHRFGNASDFRVWLDSNMNRMSADSGIRELNNVVAVHLLPYFQRFPNAWQSVTQINAQPNLSGDLDAYFAAWSNTSAGLQHPVEIANLMNVRMQIAK
jgi:hypothetical protein